MLLIGTALVAACAGRDSPSQSKASDVPALPAVYQVVYKVVTSNGFTSRQYWEVFAQTSPFAASDLTYASDPRDGVAPSSGTVTDFDHLYDLSGARLTLVSDRQPGPGSGTEAVAVEIHELQERGLIKSLGGASVAGEPCRVERFAEPPVGPIGPPSAAEHDDMCIDRSGIDAREAWTLRGKMIFERTAVELRFGRPDPAIRQAPPISTATRSTAPAILTVSEPNSGSYLAQPPVPRGFSTDPPVSTVANNPSDPSQVTDTSTIWSFSDGRAVITVEAGQGQLPWGTGGTPIVTFRLAGLGTAASALRSDGPEIRVELGHDRWVRVRGTIPPKDLASYASELKLAGA